MTGQSYTDVCPRAISPGEILVSLSKLPKRKTKALILAAITLRDVANLVRSDTQLQANTLSVRPLKATDGAKYREQKKWLTRMIPASNAGEGVALAKLPPAEHHNGLYGFDVDENVEDAAAMLEIIKAAPGVVMAGRSIGGKDLWCVFAGPKAETHEEYKGFWQAISHGFPEALKASTAEGSNDFSRARTLAYDPEIFLAESVIPLQVEAAAIPAAPEEDEEDDKKVATLPDPRLLVMIEVPQERPDWVSRVTLMKAAGYEPEDVEKWSSNGAKYAQGEVVNAWESLEPQESKNKARGLLFWMIRNGKSPAGRPLFSALTPDQAGRSGGAAPCYGGYGGENG